MGIGGLSSGGILVGNDRSPRLRKPMALSSRTSHKRVARSMGLVSWLRAHDVRYLSRCQLRPEENRVFWWDTRHDFCFTIHNGNYLLRSNHSRAPCKDALSAVVSLGCLPGSPVVCRNSALQLQHPVRSGQPWTGRMRESPNPDRLSAIEPTPTHGRVPYWIVVLTAGDTRIEFLQ